MGRDKALLPVGGRAMARRVADALLAAGAVGVAAVGGDEAALGALGLTVVPDDEPGEGPLPATITALRSASEAIVLVAACDLVNPEPDALRATVGALAEAPGALGAVAVDRAGEIQWTHAAWRRDARSALQAARRGGARSLRRAAAGLELVKLTGLPDRALADADAPGDLPAPG